MIDWLWMLLEWAGWGLVIVGAFIAAWFVALIYVTRDEDG